MAYALVHLLGDYLAPLTHPDQQKPAYILAMPLSYPQVLLAELGQMRCLHVLFIIVGHLYSPLLFTPVHISCSSFTVCGGCRSLLGHESVHPARAGPVQGHQNGVC